jgi:sulfoxide reductase heme-binding subunit YedZ
MRGWICVPTIKRGKKPSTLVRILFHVVCGLPLAWILYAYFGGRLSVNPIQDIEQQLGHYALYFLFATLAITPLHTLFGWRQPLKFRRALGLYCFLYASLHVLAFSGLDYGFNLQLIAGIVIKKPFAILGMLAFLLLLPLAVTSFGSWRRRLAHRWTNIHRLVYLAGILVVLHYAWARKGNLFSLSGDIQRPLAWGLLLLVLLSLRVSPIRRWVDDLRQRFARQPD